MSDWDGYILENYKFSFDPDTVVLDVGCGEGDQMIEIVTGGSLVFGLDPDSSALAHCRSQGLSVLRASAEQVPVKDASLDGILCKVVLPYTREEQVIREFSRLLKPGGRCHLIGHGAGYYLKCLFLRPRGNIDFMVYACSSTLPSGELWEGACRVLWATRFINPGGSLRSTIKRMDSL